MRFSWIVRVFLFFFVVAGLASATEWISLGPDGGDARSLTYDPANPDRIFLGTSAGELFLSTDGGSTWSRYAHLGQGYDYVLDSVTIDPTNSQIMYAGAWSVENNGGDVFKSTDGGKTWQSLPGIHGKSIRAMALAPSDPKVIAVGALDGVFRSVDGGQTWARLSPESSKEIKNVESIAFDPKSINVIYAGTWHLPWKTEDGGRTWANIKQGIIDDSDVFSIIVDPRNPSDVFVSACSGIYKSETAGQMFRKVQGIPFSARRTRVLQQDPSSSAIVYAGTTEGLWKTADGGASWARVSPANYVINDVLVDPQHPEKVLLATDRTGVLLSRDGGNTFASSNRGFSHRQVTAVVADKTDPERLYASLLNNREFGSVYLSVNGGTGWAPLTAGLGNRDVFSLDRTAKGTVVAGTNDGIYALEAAGRDWKPMNLTLREKVTTIRLKGHTKKYPKTRVRREWIKGNISGRVSQVEVESDRWYAATSQGLFRSLDAGKSWTGGPVLGNTDIVAVDSADHMVFAASPGASLLSEDGGITWTSLKLPMYVSRVFSVAIGPKNQLWMATHLGAYRSNDLGQTWEHVLAGNPLSNISFVRFDQQGQRLLGVAGARNQVVESRDGGNTWTVAANAQYPIRNVTAFDGRMMAVTDFNGVVAEPQAESSRVAGGGGN